MFEHWGEFYLLAGTSAAVLIGLIFVVVTLMHDRPRSAVLFGSKLYMGPIVLHMSFVLVLSAAALAPGIEANRYAAIAGAIAAWGLVRGLYSVAGIRGIRGEDSPDWTDIWFYGAIPAALYVALGAVAAVFWRGWYWAEYGVAVVITGLVLLSIRNEWDLVTWLAPRPDGPEPNFEPARKARSGAE